MGFFSTFISDGPEKRSAHGVRERRGESTIDLKRRGFIFGAVATGLVVAAPKSFFIVKPLPLVQVTVVPETLLYDLPKEWALKLAAKLAAQEIAPSDIPRWVVLNSDVYDKLVASDDEATRRAVAAARRAERSAKLYEEELGTA